MSHSLLNQSSMEGLNLSVSLGLSKKKKKKGAMKILSWKSQTEVLMGSSIRDRAKEEVLVMAP